MGTYRERFDLLAYLMLKRKSWIILLPFDFQVHLPSPMT